MTLRVRVSSTGLTRCPGCQSHIRVAPTVAETTCPFCDARLGVELAADPGSVSGLQGVWRAGRGGLLAAALLGAPLAACGSEEDPPAGADATEDSGGSVDAGSGDTATTDVEDGEVIEDVEVVEDVEVIEDMVEVAPPMDVYGSPPDVPEVLEEVGVGDADVDTEPAPDAQPMPEYGAPPPADAE